MIVNIRSGLLAFLAMFMLYSSPALGQRNPETMRERMEVQNKELMASLKLNEEQLPVVEKILNDELDKRSKLMAERDGSGGFGAMRGKMEKLKSETVSLLGEVLTEGQMTSFREFREKNRRGERQGEPPGPRGDNGTR